MLMTLSGLGLAIALCSVAAVTATLSAPNCTVSSYNWTYNTLGQDPCVIAASLEGVCSNGTFTLPALSQGQHYTGPKANATDPEDARDLCKCNTVTYSLISACTACQNSTWSTWDDWSYNCTAVWIDGEYPKSIPNETRVPAWAYLPVVKSNLWSNSSAFNASLNNSMPESTALARPTTSIVILPPASTVTITPVASSTTGTSSSTANEGPESIPRPRGVFAVLVGILGVLCAF
ncbi:hypothetical protein PENSPDRAFT_648941 [Peniophora sp. CONT]|nr:hypothetical protein PENSPDRAFT_648941 [Peniophora sp. CONT]